MSWDIFVMDLPQETRTVKEIRDDFEPVPIGQKSDLIQRILEVVPFADFSDSSWGIIDGQDFSIEVNIGIDDPVKSFVFHVRGGAMSAGLITAILNHLKLRALDGYSQTGFFERANAEQSLKQWYQYRERVME